VLTIGLYKHGGANAEPLQCLLSGGHMQEFSSGNTGTSCGVKARSSAEIMDELRSGGVAYTQSFTSACVCGANRCWDYIQSKCIDTADYQAK
jgi:hypothetical protein